MEKQPEQNYFEICQQFQLEGLPVKFQPISVGLINQTIKLTTTGKSYILQRINQQVFKEPALMMENIEMAAFALERKKYPRHILKPIYTKPGASYYKDANEQYWRMFPFVENAVSYDHVDDPSLAYEAAMAFGEYIAYLADLKQDDFYTTIPDFHNTPLRFEYFKSAVKITPSEKLQQASPAIQWANELAYLLDNYSNMAQWTSIVHNDTKINNLLFDQHAKRPVCVIDLDTLMPGFPAYDFGDMVRTTASTVTENEPNLQKVAFRMDIFEALMAGYFEGIKGFPFAISQEYLETGTALIIYEQAIRFLTDFLQNDRYYPVAYATQNLDRTLNQFTLLRDFLKNIKLPRH